MKLNYWNWVFNNLKMHFHFDSRYLLGVSSYSTGRPENPVTKASISVKELLRRLSPSAAQPIGPVLDRWTEEGKPINQQLLRLFINQLRSHKRYAQALEVSQWMADKWYFKKTACDIAIRLDLITEVHGIEEAEHSFYRVPKIFKGLEVHSALLNCYVRKRSVEKAGLLMQRMRCLGFDRSTVIFDNLLGLYYKVGNYMIMDSLVLEMDQKGIARSANTYRILLGAYAAQRSVDKMDRVVRMAESDSNVALNWSFYSTAADGYIRVCDFDKALASLKKSEELLEQRGIVYDYLLTLYTKLHKKEEVLRLWELYNQNMKVYNKGYTVMIISLLKFDDIESAERIFNEWESQAPRNLTNDNRIPNYLLGAYTRNGLLDKFETLVNRMKLKGGKPDFWSWYCFATALIQKNEMEKAVEAMKEALSCSMPRRKPGEKSLVACINYLKGTGDIDKSEKFVKLLRDMGIISPILQKKLELCKR